MSDHEHRNSNTNGNTDVATRNSTTDTATRDSSRMRRLDPFSMLNDLEVMMDRTFGRRWPLFRALPGIVGTEAGWTPQIDMYERDNQLVIKAELPGISKDDIDVSLDQGDLVIKGERKSEHENQEGSVYRMERSYGSFYRRIPMPEGVKEDDISASFNDGVLEIKAPSTQSRSAESAKKIAIQ